MLRRNSPQPAPFARMTEGTDPMTFALNGLLVGPVMPLDGRTSSGIDKRPVQRPLRLTREGFEDDAQADRRYHGGPEKAVHHYAFDHYACWRQEIGTRPVLEGPGAFGENLSTIGLVETNVAIGDVFRLGEAVIAVSQGRQPCWKLNLRFGVEDMARRVQTSGLTGWYYRVVEEGVVRPDDSLVLLDRPTPDWTLGRLWRVLYIAPLDRDELAGMAALPHLPENWRRLAERRLAARAVEDWTKRLEGSPTP